jgi:hypothetical protein
MPRERWCLVFEAPNQQETDPSRKEHANDACCGCWIDESCESTNLRLGDEKLIVLVVVDRDDQFAVANTARTFRALHMVYNKEPMKPVGLPGRNYEVEVCLIFTVEVGSTRLSADFHSPLKTV